ncbi:MAG: helix-turn-helix domain-containing protein [Lachnospiraceae bacterium]|nr:helix-turn-helix domain-containing protein [Lachnospiraceae bacterium]
MDLMKTGKFIADLRKEKGFTQEQLGDKIGVTNKTVSRWETGVYLPPADVMLALGELFNVSVNEILSGKRLTDAEYKEAAEENLTQAIKASSFSLKDKIEFFKKKWLKEHIAILVFIGICIMAVLIVGIMIKNAILVSITPMLILVAQSWRNNAMMAYVERNAYDGTGN